MNNNDPMKRFGYIVFSICLFALSACTSHEQMDQEEGIVKVSMGLTAASFTDDDATTRAEQPMAPDYENLISNLWILQFDREGILTGSEHKVLPTPVLNTTLEGIALRTGRGTVCVVGNLADGEIAAWPDNLSGFKSLVVDMGWLKERNTDRNVCLFGYYEGEIAAGTTAVNVVLGRLVGRDIQQREDPVAECADQRLFVPFGCISVTGRRRELYGRGCHRCRQSIGDSPPLPLLLYG